MISRRSIWAAVLAALLLPPMAGAQPTAGSTVNAGSEVPASLLAWVEGLFGLPPPEEPLSPEVRAAAVALRTLAVDTMQALARRWFAEELALSAAPGADGVEYIDSSLWRRVVNELALWRVDAVGGAQVDAAELEFWRGDGACITLDHGSTFHTVLRMLQRATPSQRAVLLGAERERIQRWGTPRPVALAAPLPSAYAAQDALLQRVLSGATVNPPWPPLLSRYMTAADDWHKERESDRFLRCLKAQWWLHAGAPPDEALKLLRHAQVFRADEWWSPPPKQPPGSDYPAVAAMQLVTGVVTVGVDVDAQGRVLRAAVVERQISVEGVRGNVPLAFEALLDGPSTERLLGKTIDKPAAAQLKDGVARDIKVQMRWNLK